MYRQLDQNRQLSNTPAPMDFAMDFAVAAPPVRGDDPANNESDSLLMEHPLGHSHPMSRARTLMKIEF